MREARRNARVGDAADNKFASANTPNPPIKAVDRRHRALRDETMGDPHAYAMENTDTTSPVAPTLLDRLVEISGSTPAMMNASVPIANVPSASRKARRSMAPKISSPDVGQRGTAPSDLSCQRRHSLCPGPASARWPSRYLYCRPVRRWVFH
jgi:hypothetical protein